MRLCHLIDANIPSFAVRDSAYVNPRPDYTILVQCLDADTLTDQQVWDIAARWTGLRNFAKLYENPAVRKMHSKGNCWVYHNWYGSPMILHPKTAVDLARVLLRCQGKLKGVHDWRPKCLDYARFYSALTGLWLNLESAKLAKSYECDLVSRSNDLFGRVAKLWSYREDLRATLEGIEVYDFLYSFIVPRLPCFSINRFRSWVPPDAGDPDRAIYDQWNDFISFLPMHLNPADILDLVQNPRLRWSPLRKQEYFLSRGFGDSRHQQRPRIRDFQWGDADDFFSLAFLEQRGLVDELAGRSDDLYGDMDFITRWRDIREDTHGAIWKRFMRGNFNELESRCMRYLQT